MHGWWRATIPETHELRRSEQKPPIRPESPSLPHGLTGAFEGNGLELSTRNLVDHIGFGVRAGG